MLDQSVNDPSLDPRKHGTSVSYGGDSGGTDSPSKSSISSPRDHSNNSGYSDMHSSPAQEDIDLVTIQAKHKLMVTLMEDVYTIFDSNWRADARTCATSTSGSSQNQPSQSSSSYPNVHSNTKKRMRGRESPPPDDSNSKRGRKSASNQHSRPYACPFHKYNPQKFTLNHDTGAIYRSCLGPGFSNVSQVK